MRYFYQPINLYLITSMCFVALLPSAIQASDAPSSGVVCGRELESTHLGFANAQWFLAYEAGVAVANPFHRPSSPIADVIDAHRSQLNELIGYELLKEWRQAGLVVDSEFNLRSTRLVGIEPEHIMDRTYKPGHGIEVAEGITPGAPLSAFKMKFENAKAYEEPSEPGYLYFDAKVTFSAERLMSVSAALRHMNSVTYRLRIKVKKDQLESLAQEIPITATENKAERSKTYIMGQISLEMLKAQANVNEWTRDDFPLLSKVVLEGDNKDEILGLDMSDQFDPKFVIKMNSIDPVKFVHVSFDWIHRRALREVELSKAEYQEIAQWKELNLLKQSESIEEGLTNESMASPVLSEPALNSLVRPLSDSAYAIVARPNHMLYSPRSARGVMEALLDEVRKLEANPPESMKGLVFSKLLRAVKHDPRIFGYQDFPGGEVTLGSSQNEEERFDDDTENGINGERVKATVSPFSMGSHIPQWVVVLWRILHNKVKDIDNDGNKKILLPIFRDEEHSDGDFIDLGTFDGERIAMNANHPAENISWFEAEEFLKWFNELPGIKASGCQYELPSSTQWEYVSRYLGINPDTGAPIFSENARPFTDGQLPNYSIYSNNSSRRTHAVGSKWSFPGSGLYDVLGNVYTWTKDHLNWNARSLSELPNRIDPVVENGPIRVFRGGGWGSVAQPLRSASRGGDHPNLRDGDVGLRLVRHCGPLGTQ